MARQHLGKCAFAAAVAAHHRMDLAGPQGEVHPLEDRLVLHAGMETADLKQNVGVGANHGRENKRIRNRNNRRQLWQQGRADRRASRPTLPT